MRTGHFTQVVWKSTKYIGFGIAVGQKGHVYVVARYYPAGNYGNQYRQNVLPLTNDITTNVRTPKAQTTIYIHRTNNNNKMKTRATTYNNDKTTVLPRRKNTKYISKQKLKNKSNNCCDRMLNYFLFSAIYFILCYKFICL